MFIAEAGVIRRLAQDGPCVILGRSADYVLADMPNHFAIFVCADDKYRQQRGKDVYEGKTLKELDRENEKRAATTIIIQAENGANRPITI